jgi:hypothetical protein
MKPYTLIRTLIRQFLPPHLRLSTLTSESATLSAFHPQNPRHRPDTTLLEHCYQCMTKYTSYAKPRKLRICQFGTASMCNVQDPEEEVRQEDPEVFSLPEVRSYGGIGVAFAPWIVQL